MISTKFLGIILLEKDPKFFVCSGWGGGWLLLAKGRRDLNVLGNCIKCIDCDTRVSVVPPGALVYIDTYMLAPQQSETNFFFKPWQQLISKLHLFQTMAATSKIINKSPGGQDAHPSIAVNRISQYIKK